MRGRVDVPDTELSEAVRLPQYIDTSLRVHRFTAGPL
jgi:hypothetical protein